MPLRSASNGALAPLSFPTNVGGLSSSHQQEHSLPGGWIVHKYGGTAVGKMPEGIADIVKYIGLRDNRIAVVCSARSTKTKSEGTTNRLLRAAREAERPKSQQYVAIVQTMRQDHLDAATKSVYDAEILEKLKVDINGECDNLIKILESAHHLEEVSTRVQDKIVSKGEKLSCLYMTAVLQNKGLDAVYVDVADIFNSSSAWKSSPVSASPSEDFYIQVARTLGSEIEAITRKSEEEGKQVVPVVTGFFGAVPGGLLNSIGRGYTDLCAALIALGLGAEELQIWKEIAGVYTADPNKVAGARLLPNISPSEAAELTFYGSEVIHPFTMEQVIRARIPIRIKNVLNPKAAGTIILPDAESVELKARSPLMENKLFRTRVPHEVHINGTPTDDRKMSISRPKRPTAVTVKPNIVILHVHSNKKTRAHGFLRHIFEVLDSCHLSVDLLSSSEVAVSCALHSDTVALLEGESGAGTPGGIEVQIASEDLRNAVRDLSQMGTVDIVPNMAIISLVGKELRRMTGISGRFLSTLGANNINVEMISQGASEINISCVIDNRVADRALNVVHTNLFTFLD
ncbi:MAG: Aspartokinase [Chrysothrix sp. TS-e1954]|nr:MAG: Aspartokinase [Chrysothrix sp. TS-e1954]